MFRLGGAWAFVCGG